MEGGRGGGGGGKRKLQRKCNNKCHTNVDFVTHLGAFQRTTPFFVSSRDL